MLLIMKAFLEPINAEAYRSLCEAGEDLLTLHRLNVPNTLHRSLLSTNAIENSFLNTRRKHGRVTRFRAETDQASRWLSYALLEAEKGRAGRAVLAEVAFGEQTLLSLRVPIPPRPELEVRLSSAETDVAWMVCDGLSNRDIALSRGTAERTVANQVASIFSKLGVSRRFDVAQFLLGLR